MALIQTRRGFLGGIAAAGAAGLLGTKRARAAEGKLETTTVRLPKSEAICAAPQDLAEGFLREEGFTDIRYVPAPPPLNTPEQIERGALDFGMNYAPVMLAGIDRGVPMTVLAGVLVGCFELLVTGEFHGITDLKGKSIGIQAVGSYEYWFLSVIAANIGIDPRRDIRWVTAGGKVRPKEVFTDGKIDAFLAFPPDVQELRARHIGRSVLNSTIDHPWSQYFCCVFAGSKSYVQNYPVATRRVLRAILRATDLCAREPARAARLLVDGGFTPNYDYALQTMHDVAYDKWREYDPEDTMRFYALRMHELGFIKSTPQKIIASGTDWRFLNELKQELKA